MHFIHTFLMIRTLNSLHLRSGKLTARGPLRYCWLFYLVMVHYRSQKSLDSTFFHLCHGHTDLNRPVRSREDFKSFQKARHHPFTMRNMVCSLKSSPSTSHSIFEANRAFDSGLLECRKRCNCTSILQSVKDEKYISKYEIKTFRSKSCSIMLLL